MIGVGLSACGNDKKEEEPVAQSDVADTNETEEPAENTTENAAENTTESAAENAVENTAEKLKEVLTIGYAGTDKYGSTVYWAVNADATYGVLLVVSADASTKVSFVGDILSHDNSLTITDKSTGNSKTVNIQPVTTSDGDKALQLTDEAGDPTVLLPVEAGKVIDAILAADAN